MEQKIGEKDSYERCGNVTLYTLNFAEKGARTDGGDRRNGKPRNRV
jgi:hypothetical protein